MTLQEALASWRDNALARKDPEFALIIAAAEEAEGLRADAERFEWVLPLIGGSDTPDADARTIALGQALIRGLTDRAAIDAARALTNPQEGK